MAPHGRRAPAGAAPGAAAAARVAATALLLLAASARAAVIGKVCDPFTAPRYQWQLVDNGFYGLANNVSRYRPSLAHFNGRLLLLGGLDAQIAADNNDVGNTAAWLQDVWASADAGWSWTRLASAAFPRPRQSFRLLNSPVYLPTKQLFLAGGLVVNADPITAAAQPLVPTASVLATSDGAHWADADWALPTPMASFGLAFNPNDGRLYVIGDGQTTVQSIPWELRASGLWQSFNTPLGPRRQLTLFAGIASGVIVAYGGNTSYVPAVTPPSLTPSPSPQGAYADVWVSATSGATWQKRSYLGPVPGTVITAGFGAGVTEGGMFLFTAVNSAVTVACTDDSWYRWTADPVIDTSAGVPSTFYDE